MFVGAGAAGGAGMVRVIFVLAAGGGGSFNVLVSGMAAGLVSGAGVLGMVVAAGVGLVSPSWKALVLRVE